MSTLTPPRRRGLIPLALGIVYVVWGSTYLALEVAIVAVPPFLLLGARFAIAGALLLGWASTRTGGLGRITWRTWRDAAVTAVTLLLAGTGLTALAQTRITSGTAALLAATVPIWMALVARVAFGDRLGPRAWVGLALGLAGVGVIVDPSGGGDLVGMVLVLAAAAAWAAGSLRSRTVSAPARPMVGAALEMLAAAPMFGLVALLTGEHRRIELAVIDLTTVVAFVYLVVAGSLLAFTAYRWLLGNASTALVGTYAYVNPVVAVTLGAIVLGEAVTARTGIGGAIVLVALVLLITGRPGVPVPAQPTSGADVFAGSARWHRTRTTLGRLPGAARLYRDPGAPLLREVVSRD